MGEPASAPQTIDTGRRIVEQLGPFLRRVAGGQALERVPQHRVAAGNGIYREVRFEHAAIGTKLLYGELVIGPGRVGQLLAGGWPGALVPAESVDLHVDPAELGHDIRAAGKLAEGGAPVG